MVFLPQRLLWLSGKVSGLICCLIGFAQKFTCWVRTVHSQEFAHYRRARLHNAQMGSQMPASGKWKAFGLCLAGSLVQGSLTFAHAGQRA